MTYLSHLHFYFNSFFNPFIFSFRVTRSVRYAPHAGRLVAINPVRARSLRRVKHYVRTRQKCFSQIVERLKR